MALSKSLMSVVREIHVTPNIVTNFSYVKLRDPFAPFAVSLPAYINPFYKTPHLESIFPFGHFTAAAAAGILPGQKGLDLASPVVLPNSPTVVPEIIDTLIVHHTEWAFLSGLSLTSQVQYIIDSDVSFLIDNVVLAGI